MRNRRIVISVTQAQMDLISDLDRMPRRDQGTRIRDLAMIGLTLLKGGAVAAPVSPSKPDEKPEEDARERRKKFPPGLRESLER